LWRSCSDAMTTSLQLGSYIYMYIYIYTRFLGAYPLCQAGDIFLMTYPHKNIYVWFYIPTSTSIRYWWHYIISSSWQMLVMSIYIIKHRHPNIHIESCIYIYITLYNDIYIYIYKNNNSMNSNTLNVAIHMIIWLCIYTVYIT
jgi:hypothetical protein